MIQKITWPQTFEKGNPFGGKDGIRPLTLTFHSKVFEDTSQEENRALEILYEICEANNINNASFDGRVFPKIIFGNPDNIEESDIRIINKDGEFLSFHAGIMPGRISKDLIIRYMQYYSSEHQAELDSIREELIEAEAHYALRRDIFVSSSSFLIMNRNKMSETNIFTPSEALKIVGLCIRTQNEHRWVSEVAGNVRYLDSNHGFFDILTRALLPNRWRFAKYLYNIKKIGEENYWGINVIDRCSSALQARDELAKLFYMPDTHSSADKRKYHFDYLTLLLAGALDVLALIINKIFDLGLNSTECSFSLKREKFWKKLRDNPRASKIYYLGNTSPSKNLIEILYLLRNKIHSVSLDENFTIPETDEDILLDNIYNYDSVTHWGIFKERVIAYINENPPVPSYNIKINKYYLAYELLKETFNLINEIMGLVTPEDVQEKPPSEMARCIERYLCLG